MGIFEKLGNRVNNERVSVGGELSEQGWVHEDLFQENDGEGGMSFGNEGRDVLEVKRDYSGNIGRKEGCVKRLWVAIRKRALLNETKKKALKSWKIH
jgi:hypothetical protein